MKRKKKIDLEIQFSAGGKDAFVCAKVREIHMNIDILFQIAAVGIIVAVLNQVLSRSDRPEQATMVSVAGLIIVLLMLVGEIGTLFDTLRSVFRL